MWTANNPLDTITVHGFSARVSVFFPSVDGLKSTSQGCKAAYCLLDFAEHTKPNRAGALFHFVITLFPRH